MSIDSGKGVSVALGSRSLMGVMPPLTVADHRNAAADAGAEARGPSERLIAEQEDDPWWQEHDKLVSEIDSIERRMRRQERATVVIYLLAGLTLGLLAGVIMHLRGMW